MVIPSSQSAEIPVVSIFLSLYSQYFSEGALLAKPNYQYEKRQRDLAKKKKQEEKQQEKNQRKLDKSADPQRTPPEP